MITDDAKRQMQEAKRLIDAGEYVQARDMLIGINHPAAEQWITQLNVRIKFESPPAPRSRRRWPVYVAVVVALLVVAVAVYIVQMSLSAQAAGDRMNVYIRLIDYCIPLTRDTGVDCGVWANSVIDEDRSVWTCQDIWPDQDSGFQDCLSRLAVYPPGVSP